MLKLEDITIANGDFTLAADLTVAPGSSVAVIGPSGAGKSTLLEAIAGFRELRRGHILWQGQDLTDLPPGKRPVAMLFQDGNLFPHLTASAECRTGFAAKRPAHTVRARAGPICAFTGSGWPIRARANQRNCLADSKAASRWRGFWFSNAPVCCLMNLSRPLAPHSRPRCWIWSPNWYPRPGLRC